MAKGEVYERMREDIISGVLAPGERLIETNLADRYGTSRTPIREALRRLEQDGLAERSARSLRVRVASPEEILEIYDVRIGLEGIAAHSAAEHASELDLARLRSAQEAMRELETGDPPTLARANRQFHETLWRASHNATLVDLLIRLHSHLLRYPETTLSYPGRWQAAIGEHEGLVAAIGDGRASEARRVAEEHMRRARDIRLKLYAVDAPGW